MKSTLGNIDELYATCRHCRHLSQCQLRYAEGMAKKVRTACEKTKCELIDF